MSQTTIYAHTMYILHIRICTHHLFRILFIGDWQCRSWKRKLKKLFHKRAWFITRIVGDSRASLIACVAWKFDFFLFNRYLTNRSLSTRLHQLWRCFQCLEPHWRCMRLVEVAENGLKILKNVLIVSQNASDADRLVRSCRSPLHSHGEGVAFASENRPIDLAAEDPIGYEKYKEKIHFYPRLELLDTLQNFTLNVKNYSRLTILAEEIFEIQPKNIKTYYRKHLYTFFWWQKRIGKVGEEFDASGSQHQALARTSVGPEENLDHREKARRKSGSEVRPEAIRITNHSQTAGEIREEEHAGMKNRLFENTASFFTIFKGIERSLRYHSCVSVSFYQLMKLKIADLKQIS